MLIKKSFHGKNLNNSNKQKNSGQGAGLVAYKAEDWIVSGVKT